MVSLKAVNIRESFESLCYTLNRLNIRDNLCRLFRIIYVILFQDSKTAVGHSTNYNFSVKASN